MNRVILMGHLTRDPEMRTTATGKHVARFSVACQRRVKNRQTGQYDADFIDCVAWEKTAAFVCNYFQKGSRIALEGRLQSGSYEDKNGQKRYYTEVVVENVEFAGSKQGGTGASAARRPARAQDDVFGGDIDPDFEPMDDAELPF